MAGSMIENCRQQSTDKTSSMAEQATSRRRFLFAAGAATLVVASGCDGVNVRPGRPDPVRAEVDELVSGLERGLRSGGWMAVERYFSDDYHSTMSGIRERLDDRRQREFAPDWRLLVNRVLTQDKRVSVSLHWSHRWNDLKGKPQKRDGQSELLLRRERGELRIVDIRGNML